MPSDITNAAVLYAIIAAVMFGVYPKTSGLLRELLFFSSLAVTVSSSVQNAGVLLVFTLLIAPAYTALVQSKFSPLLFAWSFGSVSVISALVFSYEFDLPTGYTIIFCTVSAALVFVLFNDRHHQTST